MQNIEITDKRCNLAYWKPFELQSQYGHDDHGGGGSGGKEK